jgi:NAD(P)-dependent dehydrogenase (short-subunit alcohol dehydrogenase family)
MAEIAIITGAGSGVGQAVAIELAARGWKLAIIGRRRETLDQTAEQCVGGEVMPIVCDVSKEADVAEMADAVRQGLGDPSVLVNSAGTNTKSRTMADISTDDFRELIDVNLTGAFLCSRVFLSAMRQAGRGTIVNIGSDAGIYSNSVAGPAYVASKFGLRGFTQAMYAEERQHGIRCCVIQPGPIDTPLLEKRPTPLSAEQRAKILTPEDVARCVMLAIDLPDRVVVEELLVRPL